MGINITINTVVKCIDQKSAKIILMEAMKGQLLVYLTLIPKSLKTSERDGEDKELGRFFCLRF